MTKNKNNAAQIPDASQLPDRAALVRAIDIYLDTAYAGRPPEQVTGRIFTGEEDVADYLCSDRVEQTEDRECPGEIRSFGIRLGNMLYPHMKLRLSRPPGTNRFLFCVDSHDAILKAPAGSPDASALEELKKHNGDLAARIVTEWDEAGLPTERAFLRERIRAARDGNALGEHRRET